MTNTPDAAWPTQRALGDRLGRKVVGKGLIAVSTLGMLIVLAALWHGAPVQAGVVLLLTVATLEVMLRRAVSLFHAMPQPRPASLARSVSRIAQPAAAD